MPVLGPSDRVLLLDLSDLDFVEVCARQLTHGLLVGMGTDLQVQAARARFRNASHLMFHPGDGTEIPFRDAWFTVVLTPHTANPTPEIRRVLAPGGVLTPIPAAQ